MDPTRHAYEATVWLLVAWTVLQVAIALLMSLFCLVARAFGRITARFDADLHNTALVWHFTALTVVITVAVIAGFPLAT